MPARTAAAKAEAGAVSPQLVHRLDGTEGDGPADILGLDCAFFRHLEPGSPCTITVLPAACASGADDSARLTVTAVQGGEVRFSATVTYARARRLTGVRCAAL
ncbi:hypothetical protein [Kitasatospora sp. GP82]|uniref:hypothetical protein n=1 Tax=Kitasatospora sp. GP82 TaxID=3035089 RepID=UPI00247375F8|nr:hypothetical protein [Kitasatospora sp. GP82]